MQNVNKKILLLLLFVFTVYNTGIPVVIHYCQSLKKIDFSTCPMCKAEHKNSNISYKQVNNCCSTKIAVSQSNEDFIGTYHENQTLNLTFAESLPVIFTGVITTDRIFSNFTDTSPPLYSGQKLHIINSTFLI